jgi:hypothetical protein
MSDRLQLAVVGLIVLGCVWRAIKRYAPKTAWRMQASLAYSLERKGRPAWLARIGFWLRPVEIASGQGCGSGCNACGGCATNSASDSAPAPIDPLRIRTIG